MTMEIKIIVPFDDAERQTELWAREEEKIDFRRESERAARCTTAFAATELKHYLSKTLSKSMISFTTQPGKAGLNIYLHISDQTSKNETFTLEPAQNGIRITGQGRTGVLYGVYEFLRLQGWRWLDPGPAGEIAPSLTDRLVLPKTKKIYTPSLNLGRGFYFEGVSKESSQLCLWMARNRLNLSAYRPATGKLCEKLGASPVIGGHIFEAILHPDRALPSGKNLWEEHEDWFGLPADGVRKKDRAQVTQFCVCQPGLIEFLGEELLPFLMGSWKEAERVDVWGFDTWGSTCTCPKCRPLGNGTDQTLHFVSGLRSFLNQARKDGRLDHDVRLVLCGYEGTGTIDGPKNPVPQNLLAAGDYVTFYPINRCYAHDYADPACSWNVPYTDWLKSWFAPEKPMAVMMGEYYNVSKFEDLPLLFTRRIAQDLPAYYAMGVRGITYMHLPIVNWAMRTLTQVLYAQLAWDITTDVEAFVDEYFTLWYGPYAQKMQKVYDLLEEGWKYSANWRAWSAKSVLTQLLRWDGQKPTEPLTADNHMNIIASGRQSIALMKQALDILNEVRAEETRDAAKALQGCTQVAVNPIQAREMEKADHYEIRLGEDRRLLIYGLDTMTLMTEFTAYHDALYRDDRTAAETAWAQIEQTAEKLDSYFMPIGFEQPGAGLESKDALTRTQLRDLIRRCRKCRLTSI
jgi:hypothetical protein